MLALLALVQIQAPGPSLYCYPFIETHSFTVAATQDLETYRIAVLQPPPTAPAPLVVLFHGQVGSSLEMQSQLWEDYDFASKALCRGFYVLVHDGGWNEGDASCPPPNHATYGNESFLAHTDAAIADALVRYPIDPHEIYGYGMSMGGEQVLAYAARRADPSRADQNPPQGGMLAALVSQSGYLSPPLERLQQVLTPQELKLWPCAYYGSATPDYCSQRFLWQRATVIDVNPAWVDPTTCQKSPLWTWPPPASAVSRFTSQIHNIATLPMLALYTVGEDSILVHENNMLHTWLGFNYQFTHEHFLATNCNPANPCPPPNTTECVPGHKWDAACASHVLDFFAGRRLDDYLAKVNNGQMNFTLIADDRRYYHFEVDRIDPLKFGIVQWLFPATLTNTLRLLNPNLPAGVSLNVSHITVRADDAYSKLDTNSVPNYLTIETSFAVQLEVTGYDHKPRFVIEDGTPHGSPFFTWFASTQSVVFDALAGNHTYQIVP